MSTAPAPDKPTRGVILVSYPKVVFLYPSVIVALIAGFYMQLAGNQSMDTNRNAPAVATAPADGAAAADIKSISVGPTISDEKFSLTMDTNKNAPAVATAPADGAAAADIKSISVGPTMAAGAFLLTLALNLVITSFDFPRTTSVTLAALAAALFLGTMLLITYKPDLVPFATNLIKKLHPQANATFYYCYVIAMGLIYVGVFVNSKFDYWEVRQNEMLHHHGFLSDLERFPTSSLKIDKEIKDIFEYMLLKSGRMIMNPGPQQRPIILENVFFIDQKEAQITKLLSSMQVQIAPPSEQV